MTDTPENEERKQSLSTNRHPDDQKVYIVYTYTVGMRGHTTYVDGIYLNPGDAINRQEEIIPSGELGVNGSRCGKDKFGSHKCAFINVFKMGNQHTELFTTSISD